MNSRASDGSLVVGHWSFARLWSCLLLFLLPGCVSLPWTDPKKQINDSKFQPPVRVVAIWTATTIAQPGKPVTRGFGGRLYFYNDVGEAIAVEGQLVVYAYDDANKQKVRGGVDEPDRKYAFTPEQFANHFSPTDLGASYSVWIPWGPTSGPAAEVTLVPIFTSTSGNIVTGQPSRNVLKGAYDADREEEEAALENGVIRFDQRVKKTELRTTTIPVDEDTADWLKRLPPQQTQAESRANPASDREPAAVPRQPSDPQAKPGEYKPQTDERTAEPREPGRQQSDPNLNPARQHFATWDSAAPPSRATAPQQGRFAPPKFPAPASRAPPPGFGRGPMPPNPSAQPSGLSLSPEPSPSSPTPAASSGEPRMPDSRW